jgi:hypothetical protein
LGASQTKGLNQVSQIWLRLPMSEGENSAEVTYI